MGLKHIDFQVAFVSLAQAANMCISCYLPCSLNGTPVTPCYKVVVILLMLISYLSTPRGYTAVLKCDMEGTKQTKLYEIMVTLATNR